MTLNLTDLTYLHQHSGSRNTMRITHLPTGIAVQVEGQGYFEVKRLAEEELERELTKRRI